MKLSYYPDTDSLYIALKPGPSATTCEVSAGLNVDLDTNGDIVGFDIDHAAERLDLSKTGDEGLPVRTYRIG